MMFDAMTRRMDSAAWVAWALLAASLAAGFGHEVGSAPAGTMAGAGYVRWDVTVTAMLCCATLFHLVVQVSHPRSGNVYERAARWLMLMVMSVFSFRFGWMLWTIGDIYAPPVTLLAFGLLSVAHMVAAFGAVVRARRYGDAI